MWLIILFVGMFSGFLTGLMSVGGAIVATFMLMFVPSLFGTYFPMQTIAAFVTIQTITSSVSGAVYYYRQRLMDKNLILYFGFPAILGSYLSSLYANRLSDAVLRGIFALLSIGAAVMMFFPNKEKPENQKFSKGLAVILSVCVGLIGGLVGVSAGFLYIPIFLHLFRIPIRRAVGTGMVVGMMLSLGILMGKVGSDYFAYDLGLLLGIGAVLGAQLGGKLGTKIDTTLLKRIMVFTILGISVKMMFEFLAALY